MTATTLTVHGRVPVPAHSPPPGHATERLRIAILGNVSYPIREPFAGGLESMTWHLTRGMRDRGHRVLLFAGPGSDPELTAEFLDVAELELSDQARADTSMTAESFLRQHHAYLQLMLDLAGGRHGVDVVHNNSLHHLPVAMGRAVTQPVVTTLHTPPTPWLESAIAIRSRPGGDTGRFTAVSRHTARSWAHLVRAQVIHNGVDTAAWPVGPGGDALVWFGRLVPEKAPHLAVAIARAAGLPLRLAGPIADPGYFRDLVQPALGGDVEYAGHLTQPELARLVGASGVTLVTPAWDEPYGLVAAESLACGTPVAGLGRGGLWEVVDRTCGRLVAAIGDQPRDLAAAAEAVAEAALLPRAAARDRAERHCSLDRMLDRYETLYGSLVPAA